VRVEEWRRRERGVVVVTAVPNKPKLREAWNSFVQRFVRQEQLSFTVAGERAWIEEKERSGRSMRMALLPCAVPKDLLVGKHKRTSTPSQGKKVGQKQKRGSSISA
jgi:hypothetical protein